jgi:hypothetical protein
MFMTAQQEQLDELGIDQDFTDENTDIRKIEFFNINFIYPSFNKEYTIIGTNGETFCTPLKFSEVSQLINQNLSK